MLLSEVCEQIATKLLGKPGTIVECMVKSEFLDKNFGLVGHFYEVERGDKYNGLQLSGAGEVIPTRFRIVSEDKCS